MRGRIRSIKPEIHTDEELWDAEQETRLPLFRAFVGLWNYADREGRFEWRPRRLKAYILPHWEGDFSRVLDALTTRGWLVKYTCQTKKSPPQNGAPGDPSEKLYGAVRNFRKHQQINGKELPSSLPAPPYENPKNSTVPISPEHVAHVSSTRKERETDARESRAPPVKHAPIPIPLPLPSDPDPDPGGAGGASTGAGPPDPDADWSDVETMCPTDLESRAETAGVLRELSDKLGVPLVSVVDAAREFVGYWTIGEGAGKRRRHWMRKLREHIRRAHREHRLRAPGEIEHTGSASAGDDPETAALKARMASLPER